MAEKLQFDLVTPERSLASYEATEVQIPAADGDLTALANHAPLITTLRPGILKVASETGTQEYLVTGGFAEISDKSTSVLAEKAAPASEATQEMIDEIVADAKRALDNAPADQIDILAKQIADIVSLANQLGLRA
ncbi:MULTISPECIES: F0F1 ATP synthase subunit epsilon [Falsihalocynthiibacter]|uniref:ATP synthase epsilon chain n=1 Tax=Falsihalocynthiibacter arcticus TaxID=1579316 RepID=A0A126UVJ3_9RHOB|nr:F0F1 ATP synthase subunit epsilon [Falsihalocynthiibacter arcticus]AML50078.1 ATP synthase subunit epsilon [Falsihalocynthiibacter arcticus]